MLHLRTRSEEAQTVKEEAGHRARRWVVERTHSWMNRFRRLLVRWEKKADNYLRLLHLVCTHITYKWTGLSPCHINTETSETDGVPFFRMRYIPLFSGTVPV